MKLATFTPVGIAAHVPPPPDRMEIRARIEALHAQIEAAPDGPIETRHYYADGLYAREIHIPAGTWVVGSIHRREHINVLSKGDVSVVTEAGHCAQRIQAPMTFAVKAGMKALGYAHTDAVWTTFCANADNERDPDALFDRLTTKLYPEEQSMIAEGAKWLL
jgi:hypothetical protein